MRLGTMYIDEAEHAAIVRNVKAGDVLLGVDRAMARAAFTGSASPFADALPGAWIGPKRLVVWCAMIGAPLALVVSALLAVQSFSWWALLAVPSGACVWVLFAVQSANGSSRLTPVTLAWLTLVGVLYLASLDMMTLAASAVFGLAIWLQRFVYVVSAEFLHHLVLADSRALNRAGSAIALKPVTQAGVTLCAALSSPSRKQPPTSSLATSPAGDDPSFRNPHDDFSMDAHRLPTTGMIGVAARDSERELAAQLLSRAESGDPSAQVEFAYCCILGDGVPPDDHAALNWIVRAAEQDYPDGLYLLAVAYADGEFDLEVDKPRAVGLMKSAATKGQPDAQLRLGRMYSAGEGTRKNKRTAMKWFEIAVASEDPEVSRAAGLELMLAQLSSRANSIPPELDVPLRAQRYRDALATKDRNSVRRDLGNQWPP